MSPSTEPVPSPQKLFRLLDAGQISREEFQRLMAVHARELIEEMEQSRKNPVMAWMHQLFNRREAARWSGGHGETLVREILLALADEESFPPSRWLWNASHPHVPLHVFFRAREMPRFRFVKLRASAQAVTVEIEHGGSDTAPPVREEFYLRRYRDMRLMVERRAMLG